MISLTIAQLYIGILSIICLTASLLCIAFIVGMKFGKWFTYFRDLPKIDDKDTQLTVYSEEREYEK